MKTEINATWVRINETEFVRPEHILHLEIHPVGTDYEFPRSKQDDWTYLVKGSGANFKKIHIRLRLYLSTTGESGSTLNRYVYGTWATTALAEMNVPFDVAGFLNEYKHRQVES